MNSDGFQHTEYLTLSFDEKTDEKIVYEGQVVMSRYERPYFEALLSQFEGKGIQAVLEVGFGLGISAEIIQEIVSPTETHDIIEIEAGIFDDLRAFCTRYENVNPILGDVHVHDFGRTYDFLFYDPYDYNTKSLINMNPQTLDEYYRTKEVECAYKLLKQGGILCHPFFGDLEMPEISGFRKMSKGSIEVPDFPIWDQSPCNVGQLGYYIRQEVSG